MLRLTMPSLHRFRTALSQNLEGAAKAVVTGIWVYVKLLHIAGTQLNSEKTSQCSFDEHIT